MLFDMKRPSPVPDLDLVLVVANFVNSLGNISESMPEDGIVPNPSLPILRYLSLLYGLGALQYLEPHQLMDIERAILTGTG